MKHYTKKMVSGLLIISLLIAGMMSLVACSDAARLNQMDESKRAVEFMKVLSESMDEQGSYTVEMSADMKLELYGIRVNVTASGVETVSGMGTEDYFTHSEVHYFMEMDHEVTEMTMKQGYVNGKMFYYNSEEGGRLTKLWSPITTEDYVTFNKAYRANMDMSDEELVATAATRTCVQNDDKSWTATYTDYTEKGLECFDELLDGFDTMVEGVFVADVVMTVNADENFLPTTMTFEFIFEAEDDEDVMIPTMKFVANYRDIGTTQALELDLRGYYEIDDLRVATIIEKSLSDFLAKDHAEFEITVTQSLNFRGQKNSSSETDIGSFTKDESGYRFEIDAEANSEDYQIIYRDGNYQMKYDGEVLAEQTWTDSQAKAYIKGLLDPGTFSAAQVKNVELDEEASDDQKKVYKVTLKTPDISDYESALGGVNLTGVATVIVTIQNGKMTEQQYRLSMTSGTGSDIKLVISSECRYISFESSSGED